MNSSALLAASGAALQKLDPRTMIKTPVMLIVELGCAATLVCALLRPSVFAFGLAAWLFLTVVFANFAEALAEGRGRAQADALRASRSSLRAQRVGPDGGIEEVPAAELHVGDTVLVRAGQVIPGDGDVVEGAATVDESAITGESAPVIRESGGDRTAVTGGTTVLSNEIRIAITSQPGSTFMDRLIELVEGANRKKTPNETALDIFLAVLTVVFALAVVALAPMAWFSHAPQSLLVLIALLVCLIPTTIGALLSAIGIAGMDRLVKRNVLAMSGRAVEAAGDVSTLLLDKTGTITIGNREATDIIPLGGGSPRDAAYAAQLSSLADETPEGRSIVRLAETGLGLAPVPEDAYAQARFVPFSAATRMSAIRLPDRTVVKGAASEIVAWARAAGAEVPPELDAIVSRISDKGGTALVIAEATPLAGADPAAELAPEGCAHGRIVGVIRLTDILKPGMVERFAQLRRMGIKTVMITGDNARTAKAIAREAGVDDFLAEAKPEDKLALIRREQEAGAMVAMTGDGTNDAPALAQADVGLAMNTGTQAAKEAANMVDLDSDPTKIIEIVEVGKQLLITRGALTTFSIANDLAKYFAIIPAMFMAAFPGLGLLNIMGLASPESAITSAVIFNALVIVALIPLALRGVSYTPSTSSRLLSRNLLIYGLGGLIAPFIGIKLIDLVVSLIPGLA
ncbi:potassium-transporting ATPase subunit KdpB [Brevibacterium sp. 5221]|uniref:Potassium-transporting ATPase ATP-binding subunit n=1 Tax=Brevibacterium rongguiense TaxID=2695267 RepID=A0A6N9H973_9MICO|nr:potassium-transporting ATPase subunit KdpB [Brevibacterium rongguiense]MYM20587.1 potassium-transporting ATPase subunit KdpB [Brevibacterium rongguiense]